MAKKGLPDWDQETDREEREGDCEREEDGRRERTIPEAVAEAATETFARSRSRRRWPNCEGKLQCLHASEP